MTKLSAFLRTPLALSLFLGWCLGASGLPARAETNAALAGIAGVDNGTIQNGDGTGAARIDINAVPLALRKQARDASGAVLPDGAGVTPRQEIYFVLYVDNPTPIPANDIRLTDDLDESQFTLIPGSIQECTVPSGSSDAAIWNGTWLPQTDAEGANDFASAVDTGGQPGADRITVGAVSAQFNLPLVVPGSSLRAVRFRVRVN